ncbi:MAG: 4Fe-4S binding protein [Candidatus Omnitrophica bacterium]|nr:4Fe-4S binding protein [Candidatus Omnitrophota bacterium]
MIFSVSAMLILTLLSGLPCFAQDIERFPPPDFDSGYVFPQIQKPLPRAEIFQYLDVVVLLAALSLASYLVYRRRSRQGIFLLTIFSLIYFGFIREGCICSIGAIQNVTLALFDESYSIPLTAAVFFFLPLIFTLFFGRVFCAGVCPLGAMQDLVLIKPISVPPWLQHALRMLAYLYLGAAVLFAATGSAFIICEYDPFVAFFRLSGNMNVVILGVSLLVIGLFVGRPYCLYLCPYSVILRLLSKISQWRVTIGPIEDNCIQCRLCEDSCPFGAITPPTPKEMPAPGGTDRLRLVLLIALAPILITLGGWSASWAGDAFSRMNFTVRLAERIALEDAGQVEGVIDASKSFREKGLSKENLFEESFRVREQFALGGWILGGFIGFVFACKLIALSLFSERSEYEADRSECVACGRCFSTCPQSAKREKKIDAASSA